MFTAFAFVQHGRIPLFRQPKVANTANRCSRRTTVCSTKQSSVEMKVIKGLSEIVHNYDAVFLDQFGVIHNGQKLYPKAVEAIEKLHEHGVTIIIVSNSSKSPVHSRRKLEKMGVNVSYIDGIVTSGGLALERMRKVMSEEPAARVLHLNWTATRGSVRLADHNITEIVPLSEIANGVDLVLIHGADGVTRRDGSVEEVELEELRNVCRKVARCNANARVFCANPDLVTVDGAQLRVMPGALAQEFERAGGKYVHRLGKPCAVAYDAAMQMAGEKGKSRILAVGDSVGHDVLGAVNAGIDCLYIAGGINGARFGMSAAEGFCSGDPTWRWDEEVVRDIVANEARELGERGPKYVSALFRW